MLLFILMCICSAALTQARYYGKFLGEFKNPEENIKGRVYAADKNTFYIHGFSGTGKPETFFWAGSTDEPSKDGFQVSVVSGNVDSLKETSESDILLALPEGKTINDLKWLSIWNNHTETSLDNVNIISDVELPKEAVVGPLSGFAHGVSSGDVIVKNAKTFVIQNLYYDGFAPDAYFLVGTGTKPTHVGAIKLKADNDIIMPIARRYRGENVTLTLPGTLTVYDIDWLSIYCIQYRENFGHLLLPKNLNVPAVVPYLQQRFAKYQKKRRYYGTYIGNFMYGSHHVKGRVYVADKNTIVLSDFTYDGTAPDAHFWAGSTPEPSEKGFIISVKHANHQPLESYSNENVVLDLPHTKNIHDVSWLSVWTKKLGVNLGYVIFPDNVHPPKHQVIGPLSSLAHGVKSGPVVITDAQTLFIPHFYYDGRAPDAYFLVGTGKKPTHKNAIKVPDERGSVKRIQKPYRGDSITLTLPGDLTVFDIDWFSVYCIEYKENFGHVIVPNELNVPPVLDRRFMLHNTKHDVYGKYIGELFGSNSIKGKVYAISNHEIFIHGFTYDGLGPDTYFWAGTSAGASPKGLIIPDEYGRTEVLRPYSQKNIVVTLPPGRTLKGVKWIGVWSNSTQGSSAFVPIPANLKLLQRHYLDPIISDFIMSRRIVIKDSKTIFIPDIYYKNCNKPGVDFLVGTKTEGGEHGFKITEITDESGNPFSLKCFPGSDATLKLPGNFTIYDIQWFGVNYVLHWSDYNSLKFPIPSDISVPVDVTALKLETLEFDGCFEILPDKLRVSWKTLCDDILYKLEGRLARNEYMAFGLSGNQNKSQMVNADVTVVYYDMANQTVYADDYSITAKTECGDGIGVCPDTKVGGENNVELILWEKVGRLLTVVYKRPLHSGDPLDQVIPTKNDIAVVAAIGQLDKKMQPTYHGQAYTRQTVKLNFGTWNKNENCRSFHSPPIPSILNQDTWPPFRTARIGVFRMQIGPDGGRLGYTAITGQDSQGIAWWINEMLIPELTVERGKTYTFLVEGGSNASNPDSYHPLYITNNPYGGGSQDLKNLGSESHRIYAGVVKDSQGKYEPIGFGRLCVWKHKLSYDESDSSATFDDFKESLHLQCEDGEPGQLEWTPDASTPDLVYYQCFTHRNLGWKIHVIDQFE